MDFWVSGIKPKNRFFKRGKSGTKIFFIFSAIFHIILIIPKNENKSLVQLAIKTIYSTCHFKNLFFSGMPNLSLIINAFFYQSVDCTVSSDGEFAEAVLSSLSLVEPGSETSSSCSMAG